MRFGSAAALLIVVVISAGWRSGTSAAPTTWTLVNMTCAKGQVEAGRGCWAPNPGVQAEWQVHETGATWTDPRWTGKYTYLIPAAIAPGGDSVSLKVVAIAAATNTAGFAARLCVLQSPFPVKEGGGSDICAQATAPGPEKTDTARKEATLLPNGVNQGTCGPDKPNCARLWISLGDGGNVYFEYHAAASKATVVSYTFRAQFSKPDKADAPS